MKKSNLVCGIVYTLVGVMFLIVALLTDTKLDSILFGLAGAGIAPGLLMIYKYFYWSSPKRSQKYQEMLENERIELHDELKEKIRDKSGRYAYIVGLIITSAAILVFSILGKLELVENYRMIVLYLGGYFVVQIIVGIAIFNYLLKKYK
jgi:hypothetical protein